MRTVTVTGQGTAREVPDTVVVRVAASHRAAGVAEALAGAGSAADEIVAVAREHTESRRIQSTTLNLWPAYDNEGQQSGFEARHGLAVSCTDMEKAGAMIAALAERVGDRLQVESVGLEIGDTARAVQQARSAAYSDAVARANHLAELAGERVDAVQAMAEGGAPVPFADLAMSREAKGVAIQPGETSVSASVTVTFSLV
ncbi:SIMPL domain-containing protein [Nocardioides islandensis]|uniref:SIMPL domain-containing protein n=1 Tax=Nocardioides islandensis TaxID=433663 RepID=A0A930VFR8_9ACTN|nr:SIMPL domain-containing protein [Nocardioides islandensis]MBF4763792.1 SIMPL domain-containing protein [Nocardioides islandensis]